MWYMTKSAQGCLFNWIVILTDWMLYAITICFWPPAWPDLPCAAWRGCIEIGVRWMDSAYMRLQIEIIFLMIFPVDVVKIIYSSSKHQVQLRPHLYHHAVHSYTPCAHQGHHGH